MTYSPRSRDRFLRLVAVLTGTATFATMTATGVATGLAARQTGLRDRERALEQARLAEARRAAALREAARSPRVVVLTKQRPTRTVVHTRVVHQVSSGGVATVGSGSVLSSSTSGGTSGSSTAGSPGVVAPAPPPPPAPAPAPTSGS